jgi:hypothetical protein
MSNAKPLSSHQQLSESLWSAFQNMIDEIDNCNADLFNEVPPTGGWSLAQVTDHMIKAIGNVPLFFSMSCEPCSRPADEKAPEIKKIFLDFTIRMKTPPMLAPEEKSSFIPSVQATRLHELRDEALAAASSFDLTYLHKGFDFPGLGYLTRLEWLIFIVCHLQRHTHQLKEIKKLMSQR